MNSILTCSPFFAVQMFKHSMNRQCFTASLTDLLDRQVNYRGSRSEEMLLHRTVLQYFGYI